MGEGRGAGRCAGVLGVPCGRAWARTYLDGVTAPRPPERRRRPWFLGLRQKVRFFGKAVAIVDRT